jgi:carotenoid cleavage dioxygenase
MVGGLHDIVEGEDESARLWRWTIDTGKGTVREEQLDDAASDFPRVDDRRMGLDARYGYTMGLVPAQPTLMYDRYLYRYDLQTGKRERHDLGAGAHGGEPVFAPRSPGAAEDDGWVLSIVHDENANESSLVIIDARAFADEPVAKVRFPRRVPYGAHGSWLPAAN